MEKHTCPFCRNVILVARIADYNNKCPICFLGGDPVESDDDVEIIVSVLKGRKIVIEPDKPLNKTIKHNTSAVTAKIKISNWGFIDN